MKEFALVFVTILLAEMGDKTQLATLLFASGREASPVLVFVAAAAALGCATAVAVLVGAAAQRWLAALPLQAIAGAGFIAIGAWMLVEHVAGRA